MPPQCGAGARRLVGEAVLLMREALVEELAAGHDLRLRRGPGAELGARGRDAK